MKTPSLVFGATLPFRPMRTALHEHSAISLCAQSACKFDGARVLSTCINDTHKGANTHVAAEAVHTPKVSACYSSALSFFCSRTTQFKQSKKGTAALAFESKAVMSTADLSCVCSLLSESILPKMWRERSQCRSRASTSAQTMVNSCWEFTARGTSITESARVRTEALTEAS